MSKLSRKERRARAEKLRQVFKRRIEEAGVKYIKECKNSGLEPNQDDWILAMESCSNFLIKQKPQEASFVREAGLMLLREWRERQKHGQETKAETES